MIVDGGQSIGYLFEVTCNKSYLVYLGRVGTREQQNVSTLKAIRTVLVINK